MMDEVILPAPHYYTIPRLADKWSCDTATIIDYARTGQLILSVVSQGWVIERGWIEPHDKAGWMSIPMESKRSNRAILKLTPDDQFELIKTGLIENPSFDELNYDYACCSSGIGDDEIVVKLEDAIVSFDDAEALSNAKIPDKVVHFFDAPRSTVISLKPALYERALIIYDDLSKASANPHLNTVIHKLIQEPQFEHLNFETVKRYIKKKDLIKLYYDSLISKKR